MHFLHKVLDINACKVGPVHGCLHILIQNDQTGSDES
jgi:hypothetical protein